MTRLQATSAAPKPAAIARVGFLLLDQFTMIAFASALEVLRMANYLSGKSHYAWTVLTPGGRPVPASNGLALSEATTYEEAGPLDLVLVCGGTNVQQFVDEAVLRLLRRIARDGIVLGGLCTGTFSLVKAGLLDGYTCTIHWENMAGLREAHRRVEFVEELFVIDRDRITCTGGIAPIDMMLSLVRARFGKTLVAEISDQFILERVRDAQDCQHIPLAARIGFSRKALVEIASLMEANLEEPLSAEELARLAGLSLRHVQRMFHEALGMTPTAYYLRLRLRRARELLMQSKMSITEVAVSCGFKSTCHFSKSYRSVFGCTPRSARQSSAHAAPAAEPNS